MMHGREKLHSAHSSEEAAEQGWETSGGGVGAKGGDQGERGPAEHASGADPGKRSPCAGSNPCLYRDL
jgi:hypothetical protein